MRCNNYLEIQESKCLNCGKPVRGGVWCSEWNHSLGVCSDVCGRHLHQRIANGMLDASNYQDTLVFNFGRAYENTEKFIALRIRIKQLEHRLNYIQSQGNKK